MFSVIRVVLKLLPNSAAFLLTRNLAAKTQRPSVSEAEKSALAQAQRLNYGKNNQNVAWSWGRGPLVILVHGWSGSAAQLAPLALYISQLGFRCVAINVTGHGDSQGDRTDWSLFFTDIGEVVKTLGQPVDAFVGHSAGALSMMAARGLKGVTARRYVCIAAPSYPFPPLNLIRKILNPREGVMELYKRYLAEQFQISWDKLEAGSSFLGVNSAMLLVYDETDRFVPHTEGDKILRLCAGAKLVKTNQYSHSKLLLAPELNQAIKEFLT